MAGISTNLKSILKLQGKTLEDLAFESKVSIHTLHGITKRDSIPRKKTLQALANALGISEEDLLYGINVPTGLVDSSAPDAHPEVNQESNEENSEVQTKDSGEDQAEELDEDQIEEIVENHFKESLRYKYEEIQDLKENPPSELPKEAVERLIERKQVEIELLIDFFDLDPVQQLIFRKTIKQELTRQRIYENHKF